ncbi:CUB and zona pellucida-like domain-containing protein 1 [Branchiostoma floridae]|uniref:CUB and zona pellucida-like domain-containing protein 1 n=1 Tax=Branchiostoma floridae TaxID=7739 RepID=A0A9J7KIA3_BRAFL|nr:CUB and zona pellucida-like domain-containing protein 1 [Branchiostoma floridae]
MLVGPPYFDFHNVLVIYEGAYFCNRDNRTWLGTQPVCLGPYNNATMVTDDTNTIRLVGGEYYGCVEMYDNVTNQWGPVKGMRSSDPHKMGWAHLVCEDLGFPAGLATSVYPLIKGTGVVDLDFAEYQHITILSDHYRPSYPSTVPKFITVPYYHPTADRVTLRDAIDRVVRGPCASNDYSCNRHYSAMCLACAGQQNKHNSQDINAQVTCTSDSILVSFPRPADNSIQKADVQLVAPPCSADENSTHIFIRAPLTGCGTDRQDTEDDIIYSNTLAINVNASNAIVTRHHVKVITVECRLPRRTTVAVNFDPRSSSVFRSHIVGRGDFAISMELFLSNSFRFPVSEYPLSAELGQMLYVQVQVTSDDTNLQVFADTCMATPTEDPDDSTVLYHLIREGCDEDSTVARYWSPSTMEERFGFQAFAFTSGARKVYLHCDVLLCNATDPSSRCAQGCQAGGRFAREAEVDTDAYLLIQGPIVLNDDQTGRDYSSTGHVTNMVPFFLGACTVMVVAMFIGI